ncbi:MAG TPA: phosphatase PAP2 family protein [Pyrinomonadaceae bacterium]|jgi:membrane-associated phospholipid phosphatase
MNLQCLAARRLLRVLLLLAATQFMTAGARAQVVTPAPAPAPQASPAPSLERRFFKNFLGDQRAIWTLPLHLHKHDARWLVPLALSTAALVTTDPYSADLAERRTRIKVSRDISYAGSPYGTAAIAGTFYLVGRAAHNARARETGLLGAEAILDGYVVSIGLKAATQRPRPRESDGRGEFFEGGRSFPSGHAISAWSLATVVAEEYKDRAVVRFGAYGFAALVSVARYTGRSHFLSDVLVGSAVGYGIGRYVYRKHHDAGSGEAGDITTRSSLVPYVLPRYDRRAHSYGVTLAWDF